MTLPSNKVKLALTEVDYKPFISLFNVTNATVTNPEISGIGERTTVRSSAQCLLLFIADYASAVAFELSKDTTGNYVVAMKFKNGTNDSEFKPLKMFGQNTLTLPSLITALDVRPHSFLLTFVPCCDPCFRSGLPSTPLSTGASLATRLSSVDVPSSTTATIHSFIHHNWTA